jgi:hypothetical protein
MTPTLSQGAFETALSILKLNTPEIHQEDTEENLNTKEILRLCNRFLCAFLASCPANQVGAEP